MVQCLSDALLPSGHIRLMHSRSRLGAPTAGEASPHTSVPQWSDAASFAPSQSSSKGGADQADGGSEIPCEEPPDGEAVVALEAIVVRAYKAARPSRCQAATYTGPNFKRFRKNKTGRPRQPPVIVSMVEHLGANDGQHDEWLEEVRERERRAKALREQADRQFW